MEFTTDGPALSDPAAWVSDFLEELSSFPAAPHDDLVDAFVHALTYLRAPIAGQNVIDFYEQEAQRARAGEREKPPERPEPPASLDSWRRRW